MCSHSLRKSFGFTVSFYRDWWTKRRPAAIIRLTCLTWYDQESPALKGNSQCVWEAAAHGLFRLRCVPLSLTSSWWEILTIVCVCKEKKENGWEGECVSDRRRGCLWVCETEERVHEVTSRQLFDFPSFPGKQFQEQCRRKTTNHRQLKCHKKKTLALFVGDWIIAVAWDWRQGKCVSDCTVLVADTYHLPDSSTHPSPSTPHNSRNTLKKSESGGKGTQDKYCVSIFPPSPLQLSFTLTDEQWKYFELCCMLSFTPGFRTVLSKPDVFWQRLIDLLSVRHVFPLFFQDGFGFSPVRQTCV